MKNKLIIPADVPPKIESLFKKNYDAITRKTDRLMLFACDQKIEHLNADFYGQNVDLDALHPEHIFRIASQGDIGALATHVGLITRYGKQYPNINYIVKLNAKTNLIPTSQRDPLSTSLWHVEHAIHLKQTTGLNICGIGYTIYLGSEYEGAMLTQAAQAIYAAHQHGLVTILWIYLRGKSITNERDPSLAAGATGIANALGADFVKIKPVTPQDLAVATTAAGNTNVICAGGAQKEPKTFLQELYDQIHTGKSSGCATGRNIFQRALPEAIALTKALSAIVYDDKSVDAAYKILSS